MPQPYNYNTTPIDPFGSAFKGMQTGMAMNQMSQQNKLRAQQIQDKERISSELADLSEDFTVSKLRKFGVRNPDYLAKFQDLMKNMSAEEKASAESEAMQMYNLATVNPEAYVEEQKRKSEAYLASSDPELQKKGRILQGIAESAQLNINNDVSIVPSAGLSAMAVVGIDKFSKWTQTKADAELKGEQKRLLEKTTEAKKISADAAAVNAANATKKLVIEVQKLENAQNGVLDVKDKLDYEIKFANQYLKEGGDYFERADRAYMNILNAEKTGAGGLTIYLSFMKTIDPSSTVTGGEVTTAKDAPGVVSAFAQKWNNIFSEGSPSAATMRQFKAEAKNVRNNAKSYAERTKKRITNQIKKTNLDPKNIFNMARKEEKKQYDWLKDKVGGKVGESKTTERDVGVGSDRNLSSEDMKQINSFLNKFQK